MFRKIWALPLLILVGGCSSASGEPTETGSNKPPAGKTDGCPTGTGFAGDDLCLAPPKPSEGFQLHYGPSDYDDPAEVAKFTSKPGEETNDCFFQVSGNDSEVYYSGYNFQMRPGSHHLIGQSRDAVLPEQGFGKCESTDGNPAGLFAASQTPILDVRLDPAPENLGLARLVPAHTQAVINFHVINSRTEPMLREAWMNYYYLDDADVLGMRGAIDLNGGVGYHIEPKTHKTYRYSCSPTVPVRVLGLASHMHAHAKRMTIYKQSGGKLTKLLENYSWEDPAQFVFDSVHTIPKADPVTLRPGGDFSGDLYLTPSDTIQWECEILNDGDTVLTFRNEVYTGEMCLVGGSVIGMDDPMAVTDFTCARN
jgi:hypothetical protein